MFYKAKNRTRLVAIVLFDVFLLFCWAAYFLNHKNERSGLALLAMLFVTFLYVGVMRPRIAFMRKQSMRKQSKYRHRSVAADDDVDDGSCVRPLIDSPDMLSLDRPETAPGMLYQHSFNSFNKDEE